MKPQTSHDFLIKYSPIFKTLDNGNIVTSLQARKIATQELIATQQQLFSQLAIDKIALEKYELAVTQGAVSTEQFAVIMKGASIEAQNYAVSTNGAIGSSQTFVNKQRQQINTLNATAKATDLVAIKMKALNLAMNIGVMLAFSVAIKSISWALDETITTLEEQKEKVEECVSAYSASKSELQSISSELLEQQKLMSNLQRKEKLTYAEKGELERLQKITAELQIQEDLAKQNEERTQKELAIQSANLVNRQFGKDTATKEKVNEEEFKAELDSQANVSLINERDLASLLAGYRQFDKKSKDTNKETEEDIELYKETLDEKSDEIWTISTALQKQKENMQAYYDTIKDIPYEELLPDQRKVVNAYQKTSDEIKLIYSELAPDKWNEMEISSIFNRKEIEKTKEELIELEQAGKLTQDVIQSFPNLNEAIHNSDLITDGKTKMEAFKHEIEAAALGMKVLDQNTGNTSLFSLSENQSKAIDDFQSKISSLSEALQTLQSGELSSNDMTDLMQDFPTLQEESGNLETAIKQLIDNALEELYALLGQNVPENLKGVLEGITEEAKETTVSLEDSMSTLESHAKVLASANEQIKTGFTIDTLNEIISAYPKMTEAVAKYNAGLLNTTELFNLLEQCYEQDKNNYISAAMKKLETDADLFNKIMNNEELKVKQLAEAYGVDYTNWKDVASAKYSTEKQLIDDLMQLWSSYFSIMYDKNGIATVTINNAYQNYDDSFDTDVINGGQSDFDKKYQEILDSVSKYNDIIERLNQGIQLDSSLDLSWQGISTSLEKPKSSSSSKSEFSEQIDFAKYRLEELEKELDKVQSKIDNAAESSLKNHYINQLIALEEQKRATLLETLKLYQGEATKALSLIPTEYQAISQNGSIEIKDFVGENNQKVVEAIKNYRTWSDSVEETETELSHLDSTIQSLKLDKFHNIEGEYQNQLTIVSSFVDQFKDQIDLFENQGYVVSEKMYQQMIEKTNWQVKMLQKERDTLVHQMTETMKNTPNISKEHFYDMTSAISDIDKEINQCVSSLEDFANAIRDLSWENFDRLIDRLSGIESELSNLSGLLDTYDLTIEGDFTDYGLAQLGILAQQYELARYETQQYSEAIKTLEQEYKNGEWSTIEYTEKLQELIQNQWDAINASTSAKDAILELAKARIDSEISSIDDGIDAYEKLIQAQIKALQAEKDLHDFRKSVSEKQKDITSIEKQLSAIANDTSRAAEAKRVQLKEQLEKAQEELSELYYEQDNKEKQQALEDELERYKNQQEEKKNSLEESLKEEDKLISDFLDLVNKSSNTIADVLEQLAKEHGIKISSEIIKPWKGAGNAITEYENQLSNSSSNFVGSLNGIKDSVAELTMTADTLANSFTNMFQVNTSSFLSGLQNISELLNHINEAPGGTSTGGEWMYDKDKENGSWWYQHKDGSYTKNNWEKIDGEWYHFDKDGWMQTGWYQDKDGEWYYLSDGTIGKEGQMLSNATTPDGYYVDADGKWIQEVGQTSNFGSQSSSASSTTNSETNTQKVNVSEIASTLRAGSSNTEDIKKLQTALEELGYDLGKSGIDGKFGSATKKALQAFQLKNELDSDGILGEKTKKAFANAGYSTGGVASILKENDDDGFITVQKGETILTKQFTNLMPDLVENISSFNQNYPLMFPSMPSFVSNSTLPPINVENKIIVQGNLIGENAVPTVKEAQKMMDKSIDTAFRKVAERRQFQGKPFRK